MRYCFPGNSCYETIFYTNIERSSVDTFTSKHVKRSAVRARSAANVADIVKRTKYRSLANHYQFETVTIETVAVKQWQNVEHRT